MIPYEALTARNAGIIQDQECLKRATVAIAGCGGAGGKSPATFARMGVGKIRLADPDTFDVSNLNRQYGSSVRTLGQNKAQAIADLVKDINPHCEVEVFEEGITEDNIASFLQGVDVAIEEIDIQAAYFSVIFHRTARAMGIPVLTGVEVGWGANLFYFDPEGMTFEEYVGIPDGASKEEIEKHPIPITAYSPEIPEYVTEDILGMIMSGEIEIPAIAPSANLTAAMIAVYTYLLLSGAKKVEPVPYYYPVDIFNVEARRVV
ncbi:MAG: ThiF family adenylyltransferase [bacterium]|nr:ThiF family adenylyltransferase [bacterium]